MKQVTIYLARRITLNRAEREAVELQAGPNTVDADVAAHPFVKAHTVDAGPDHGAELDALRAELADTDTKQRARIAELTTEAGRLVDERDAAVARIADLEEQLAQKAADLDALVASMTPPAETKPAKAKG